MSETKADRYAAQDRGDDQAYDRYLSAMDQTMRQKVALTAAHLLGEGTVADMGCGSGTGAHALASLYPRMKVIGIDVNPEMVARARAQYAMNNLDFQTGDIAKRVLPDGSLDAIFDSSVLHHVTSFNGYDHDAAAEALSNQAVQLALGGSLIVRDFVAPATGDVLLDVPADDGDDGSDSPTASSARLLERFAREFRPLSVQPGFPVEQSTVASGDLRHGWRRYRLDLRHAVEFLLRKDYRSDYASEVLEEYTYFTQARFETEYARLGLRLLASFPIHNPWIIKNRFLGRCELRALDGAPLDWPATNYLIVGERVAPTEGVRFEMGRAVPPTAFLVSHVFEHRETGELRDLVRRPGTTVDIVPWFEKDGAVFVVARKSYPRPVLQATGTARAIDGGTPVGYVTEPILAIQRDKPLGITVEEALRTAAAIEAKDLRNLSQVASYYPSPGGIVEEVRAVHVEIEPRFTSRLADNLSGFTSSVRVRAIEARQLLRAAQVGALPDARLELNVYTLLLHRGDGFGPWIGAEVEVDDHDGGPGESFATATLPRRRAFGPAAMGRSSGFLELRCHEFIERNESGHALATHPRDFVVPAHLSTNTIACALLRKSRDTILIGLDEDDLAAAQCFGGNSALWVAPAWRLPLHCETRSAALRWVHDQLSATYGLTVTRTSELGGRYHPSAGITPEIVYPFAMGVRFLKTGRRRLLWVPLGQVVQEIDRIQDGHLRIAALRSAHALGVLDGCR